ncbi:hypothetical protein MAPG_04683 [Magnaporthiopsis poae ATCC 64411]|uniref:Uncharacterized protein n=1 Tax=Magnaporthiopsis poae (strain ATCC 64411 / 73-15) TaxID=644358 RepID=A0A0C4DXD8_MAGP6|nr:hypothetical protein MAPG_04683 [Magnaporthiopsis poae ATCC 64411]
MFLQEDFGDRCTLGPGDHDENKYAFGLIGSHNIVIAVLPHSQYSRALLPPSPEIWRISGSFPCVSPPNDGGPINEVRKRTPGHRPMVAEQRQLLVGLLYKPAYMATYMASLAVAKPRNTRPASIRRSAARQELRITSTWHHEAYLCFYPDQRPKSGFKRWASALGGVGD